ncbi:nucleoside-diphosphate kinase [Thermaerobacter composti]|uniref:Nucleoside diphosphate kinase n=1 Tax=Thermaerobacter composti TaxID=554949 RepID=A0ABZ0QRS5_9FIRM|nr:nucleoside-diphosphate kinase [Thermaerobacter composti]PZN09162.1 MAG: nucleoside-diphosphate kinase [Bacillota bacterium]WPD20076.1 nucleoside-diphosphate kinase [Thermaerobacter composti]
MERTFVMVKPDGVQRGLVGEIIARLERKGLKLVALKMVRVSEELARRHYAAHEGKPFFPGLIRFITSAPVVAMVWEGREAVAVVRNLLGPTDGAKAAPGTIRGDLANDIGFNLVHGSDSVESARREIDLWFRQDELLDWENHREAWLYDRG